MFDVGLWEKKWWTHSKRCQLKKPYGEKLLFKKKKNPVELRSLNYPFWPKLVQVLIPRKFIKEDTDPGSIQSS